MKNLKIFVSVALLASVTGWANGDQNPDPYTPYDPYNHFQNVKNNMHFFHPLQNNEDEKLDQKNCPNDLQDSDTDSVTLLDIITEWEKK